MKHLHKQVICLSLLGLSQAYGDDFAWNVAGPADWNNAANWINFNPGGPSDRYVNNGGIATITSDTTLTPIRDTKVAVGAGTSGTVNHSAGVHSEPGWGFVGGNGGVGDYNISGTGQWNTGDRLIVGFDNGNGTMDVSGNAIVAVTGETWIGQGAGGGVGFGTVNHSSGTFTSTGWLAIGREGGNGTYNLSGTGILSHTTSDHTIIGSLSGTGKVVQTGGTFNEVNDLRLGENGGGNGKYNISAGQANVNGWTIVGWVGGGTGELNVSDTGYFNSQFVEVGGGAGGAGNGTVNLNGGTIETKVISRNGGAISGQVNFNGGILKAKESNGEILPGFSAATSEILANGFKIDTNGFDTATSVGLDGVGGLTKLGGGKFTLNAANSYSGVTTVSQGTLALGSLGSLNPSSVVDVAAGATFDASAVAGGLIIPSGQTLKGDGTTVGNTTVAPGATLAPGNSIGSLDFTGTLTLNGTTNMEIDRTGPPISDEANASGTIDYGGTLNVTLLSAPATLQLGDNFDLFDAPSFFDVFTTINLPSLSGLGDGNWYWSDNLGTSGGLQVLPEPSTAAFAALASLGLLNRRRRK